MHNELSAEFANMVLSRLLEFFEAEIAQSSDAEVLEAAADLRMNPRMKGSAAFGGITYPWGLGRGQSFYGLSAEDFAALQRRFGAAEDDAEGPGLWPDSASVSDWLALIRQLREK
jgi:hypothetical protein